MLNYSFLREPCHLRHLRASSRGTLLYVDDRHSYCLTPWPELASFRKPRSSACEFTPDPRAGLKVFLAFSTPRTDFTYEDGLLWEQTSQQQLMEGIIVASGWPAYSLPHNALLYARLAMQWRDFEQRIPSEPRAIAAQFRINVVEVLRVLAVCPEATDLALANPALFFEFCVQQSWHRAEEAARRVVLESLRLPQRELLRALGLWDSEAARALLRRMPPAEVTSARLRILLRALQDRRIGAWLPQVSAPGAAEAELLADPALWPFLTPQLVRQVAAGLNRPVFEDWPEYRDRTPLALTLGRLRWFRRQVARGRARPRPFRTMGELAGLTGLPPRLRPGYEADPHAPLPPPPLPGSAEVIPLRSCAELRLEGELQANCCGQGFNLQLVRQGRCYYYRMLAPERATIEIGPGLPGQDGHAWLVTDIRTSGNGIPRLSTVQRACDALGIPAEPAWLQGDAWWTQRGRGLCEPRHPAPPSRA